MKKKFISITQPQIDRKDIDSILSAAKTGWGSRCYNKIDLFEKKFRKKFNFKFASATSSCTGALHIGLKALGINKNDEIIIPESTWISCANVVEHLGAKPVFADIKKDTWCIDPSDVEKKITKKTKAIMAVHLYGNVCDIEKLVKIKKKYKIFLIEDCAEAIGAKYKKKYVGSFGDFSAFSFHGTKLMTTGEGGMFVTQNSNLYNKYLKLHNLNVKPTNSKYFFYKKFSYKYRISNLQAALGVSQINKINKLINLKKKIFNQYKNHFKNLPIKMNTSDKNSTPVYWMTTIYIETKKQFC